MWVTILLELPLLQVAELLQLPVYFAKQPAFPGVAVVFPLLHQSDLAS